MGENSRGWRQQHWRHCPQKCDDWCRGPLSEDCSIWESGGLLERMDFFLGDV